MASNSASTNVSAPAGSYDYTIKVSFNETSTNSSNNTSTISIEGSISSAYTSWAGSNNHYLELWWYDDNNNTGGTFITNKNVPVLDKNSTASLSGSITAVHKSDGTLNGYAKIKFVKVSSNNYVPPSTDLSTPNTSLTNIPRYGTANQSISYEEETSIRMNWSSNSTVDYVWYDIGQGWVPVGYVNSTSGSYTISNLQPNTYYSIKTRLRRKDSQLTTDSSSNSTSTYPYPYITSVPNFNVGSSATIRLYNPLGRRCYISLYPTNGKEISGGYTSSSSYTGFNDTSSILKLVEYAGDKTTNTYRVHLTYSSYVDEYSSEEGTYTISNDPQYQPTFTDFDYEDGDENVVKITGDNKCIIQNISDFNVIITPENKMIPKTGASGGRYSALLNNSSGSADYSATDTVKINLGKINAYGNNSLTVTAYDNRAFFKNVVKSVSIIEYNLENDFKTGSIINLGRENGFGEKAIIKLSTSNYYPVIYNEEAKNTILSIKYRYKEENGEFNDYKNLNFTIQNNGFETDEEILYLDNEKSYEFELVLTDNFGEYTTTRKIGQGQPIFYIDAKNKSISVGTVENSDDLYAIHSLGSIHTEESLKIQKQDEDIQALMTPSTLTINEVILNEEPVKDNNAVTKKYVDNAISSGGGLDKILDTIFPVGIIIMFYDTADHSNHAGLRWQREMAGYMPIGYNSNDSDFRTIGKTGGEKTHKLTIDEMPSHSHGAWLAIPGSGGNTANDYVTALGYNFDWRWYSTLVDIDETGGDQAHNNMPPYKVVAFWRRVS